MGGKSFFYKIGDVIIDEKRNLTIIDRMLIDESTISGVVRNKKFYKIKCNNCGFDSNTIHYRGGEIKFSHKINESALKRNRGCPCCTNHVVVENINNIGLTDSWITEYMSDKSDSLKYSRNSNCKIYIKCIYCQKEKIKTISDVINDGSIGCICGDGFSYGHKYIHNILEQANISFVSNNSPTWCKFSNKFENKLNKGEYDFVIEKMNLIIEVDGKFHRNNNKMNGRTKEYSEYIDNKKDELANRNGYKIIRIPYDDIEDFNKDVISKKLGHFLDVENINWNEAKEYASKNIIFEVCNIYNSNIYTLKEIMSMKNIRGRATLIKYLKLGKELGWCDYSERKSRKLAGIKSGKPVRVFYKDIIKDYNSIKELCEDSMNILGFELKHSGVSSSLNPKHKKYKKPYKDCRFSFK